MPKILFLLLFLLLTTPILSAENKISIEPTISHEYGSAWFTMQVTEPVRVPQNEVDFTETVGQSELRYPLDVVMGGVRLLHQSQINHSRRLSLYLHIRHNLNQPSEKMEDTDWFGSKNNSVTNLYKFSYTKSRSEISWTSAELGAELNNFKLMKKNVSYGSKVLIDYSSHEMFGVAGWQKWPNTERIEFDEFQDTEVLTYQLFSIETSVYVDFDILKLAKFKWNMQFSISPFVMTKDKDDHVLRNKNSYTDAFGFGAGFGSQFEYFMIKHFAFIADARVRYFRTKGSMDQRFYADDPGAAGDQAGLEFNDIDNVISMFTQQITLGLRWQY